MELKLQALLGTRGLGDKGEMSKLPFFLTPFFSLIRQLAQTRTEQWQALGKCFRFQRPKGSGHNWVIAKPPFNPYLLSVLIRQPAQPAQEHVMLRS